MKDAEDKVLEALFAASSVADDEFSNRVIRRVRRRVWVRRLAMPVALAVGCAVAFQPLQTAARWLSSWTDQPWTIFAEPTLLAAVGALVLTAVALAIPALDD